MDNNYEFVYSLIYQGKVFYIGRCKDVLKRYRWHLHATGSANSAEYIRQILSNGEFPELNIIDWIPHQDAIAREAQIINDFSVAGHSLTNHVFAREPHYPVNKRPACPTKKDMFKIVKYKQLNYVQLCISRYRYKNNLEPLNTQYIPHPFK
jgi:hypothetical protein